LINNENVRRGLAFSLSENNKNLSENELEALLSSRVSELTESQAENFLGILENVGKSVGEGINWSNVLQGAGQGAALGSTFGPYGLAIGTVAGGILGGAGIGKPPAAATPTNIPPPAAATPTNIPPPATPTNIPPTAATLAAILQAATPTNIPPTAATPTNIPPTAATPTNIPPTAATPTNIPPTAATPTNIPPTAVKLFDLLKSQKWDEVLAALMLGSNGKKCIPVGDKCIEIGEFLNSLKQLSSAAVSEIAEMYAADYDSYNQSGEVINDPNEDERADQLIKLLNAEKESSKSNLNSTSDLYGLLSEADTIYIDLK
jgi:hypothetical protein